jgi:hypothetical protein
VKKKQSNHNQTKSCCFEKAAAKLLRSVALKAKNRDRNLNKKKNYLRKATNLLLSWWLRIEEYKKTIFAPKTKRFF